MQFEENQVNKSVETLKTEKMYRKLDKNNTKNDRTLTLWMPPNLDKIVHHFILLVGNFWLQPEGGWESQALGPRDALQD